MDIFYYIPFYVDRNFVIWHSFPFLSFIPQNSVLIMYLLGGFPKGAELFEFSWKIHSKHRKIYPEWFHHDRSIKKRGKESSYYNRIKADRDFSNSHAIRPLLGTADHAPTIEWAISYSLFQAGRNAFWTKVGVVKWQLNFLVNLKFSV